jgi:hypothetical protein
VWRVIRVDDFEMPEGAQAGGHKAFRERASEFTIDCGYCDREVSPASETFL